MKVTISTSANSNIDKYYGSVARSIANYLAHNEFDLVFGGCSTSMMGVCYDEFKKNDRKIYIYTTEPYIKELDNLEYDDCEICNTTFELKQKMFYDSDVIVALPGGVGTLSELLAFIEESRSNAQDKLVIVYDENHFYDKFIGVLDEYIKNNFATNSIYDYFYLAHNKQEFINALDNLYVKSK